MDWKIFLTTFGTIFVAELADKTQFVGVALSAKSGNPVSVFTGSVCAYVIVTAISVILGAVLAEYLSPQVIKYTGGTLFVLIGFFILFGKI